MKLSKRPRPSVEERFLKLSKAWRKRRNVRIVLWSSLAIGFGAWLISSFVGRGPSFWLGIVLGGAVIAYALLRDWHPPHIETWRMGMEGEHRTRQALASLDQDAWFVEHDIIKDNGSNLDHVVVGRGRVYVLDSKVLSGEAFIDRRELRTRLIEDQSTIRTHDDIPRSMRAQGAQLSRYLTAAVGSHVAVTPVVVLWTPFEQRAASIGDRVFFVHGDALIEWLRGEAIGDRRMDREAVQAAIASAKADVLPLAPFARAAGE